MRTIVVVLVLCLIASAPMLSALTPALCSADVAIARDEGSAGESELTFWDWCVLYWTTHLDDWPI